MRARRAVCVVVGLFQMCMSPPQGIFVRWLKLNFSEVFVAWIHLKALRVFVESALRSALKSLIVTFFFLNNNKIETAHDSCSCHLYVC